MRAVKSWINVFTWVLRSSSSISLGRKCECIFYLHVCRVGFLFVFWKPFIFLLGESLSVFKSVVNVPFTLAEWKRCNFLAVSWWIKYTQFISQWIKTDLVCLISYLLHYVYCSLYHDWFLIYEALWTCIHNAFRVRGITVLPMKNNLWGIGTSSEC